MRPAVRTSRDSDPGNSASSASCDSLSRLLRFADRKRCASAYSSPKTLYPPGEAAQMLGSRPSGCSCAQLAEQARSQKRCLGLTSQKRCLGLTIQASGAVPGHGIAQHQPRLGRHWRRGQQWLCPPVRLLVHHKARVPVRPCVPRAARQRHREVATAVATHRRPSKPTTKQTFDSAHTQAEDVSVTRHGEEKGVSNLRRGPC